MTFFTFSPEFFISRLQVFIIQRSVLTLRDNKHGFNVRILCSAFQYQRTPQSTTDPSNTVLFCCCCVVFVERYTQSHWKKIPLQSNRPICSEVITSARPSFCHYKYQRFPNACFVSKFFYGFAHHPLRNFPFSIGIFHSLLPQR